MEGNTNLMYPQNKEIWLKILYTAFLPTPALSTLVKPVALDTVKVFSHLSKPLMARITYFPLYLNLRVSNTWLALKNVGWINLLRL